MDGRKEGGRREGEDQEVEFCGVGGGDEVADDERRQRDEDLAEEEDRYLPTNHVTVRHPEKGIVMCVRIKSQGSGVTRQGSDEGQSQGQGQGQGQGPGPGQGQGPTNRVTVHNPRSDTNW